MIRSQSRVERVLRDILDALEAAPEGSYTCQSASRRILASSRFTAAPCSRLRMNAANSLRKARFVTPATELQGA